MEYPKASCKLSKTLSWTKKVSQIGSPVKKFTSPLYSETAKLKYFLMKQKL